jgi:hypothetical protein
MKAKERRQPPRVFLEKSADFAEKTGDGFLRNAEKCNFWQSVAASKSAWKSEVVIALA